MKTKIFHLRKSTLMVALALVAMLSLTHSRLALVDSIALAQGGAGEKTQPKKTTSSSKKTTGQPRRTTPTRRTTTAEQTSSNSAAEEAAATERTYWESVRNSTNPEDFRAYLRNYPNGQFADLARNRISSLETAAKAKTEDNERAYWASIEESKNFEDFRAYLRSYPRGLFAGLATNKLKSLGMLVTNENGDRLEVMSITPTLPARLGLNTEVTLKIAYQLKSGAACRIWALPVTNSPDYYNSASQPLAGAGEIIRGIGFTKLADLYQIELRMVEVTAQGNGRTILTSTIRIRAHWGE